MLEQIKDLCLFMICGQTLLYFQSGKKYEKICRMILELLILAGIVGMVLNFLQSLGFRKGEMEAAGGAVAGMQRSMEEALSRQLEAEGFSEMFQSGDGLEELIEKHTMEEIKSRYNNFAKQYGYEIEQIKVENDKLQVFLKEAGKDEMRSGENEDLAANKDSAENTDFMESKDSAYNENFARNPAKIDEIEPVEIGEIIVSEAEEESADKEVEEAHSENSETKREKLETFRRQLALVFAMDEEKLEVILID